MGALAYSLATRSVMYVAQPLGRRVLAHIISHGGKGQPRRNPSWLDTRNTANTVSSFCFRLVFHNAPAGGGTHLPTHPPTHPPCQCPRWQRLRPATSVRARRRRSRSWRNLGEGPATSPLRHASAGASRETINNARRWNRNGGGLEVERKRRGFIRVVRMVKQKRRGGRADGSYILTST